MPIDVSKISDDPAQLKAALAALMTENADLRRLVEYLEKQRFRKSSETYVGMQPLFVDTKPDDVDPEAEPTKTRPPRPEGGSKPVRKPLPERFERKIIRHELSGSDRLCTCCGGDLHEIGVEASEQLDIVPATVKVIRHERVKYGCRGCESSVTMAPIPKHPIPKSLASPATLAHIAVAKYADHRVPRTYQLGRRYGADLEMRDWPLAAGDQAQAANHCMLLPLRAVVVSDADRAEQYSVSVRLEETSESKLSMKRRNRIVDVKTGNGGRPGISASGVLKTGSRGIRLEGSVNSRQALGRNVGTCRRNAKEKNQVGGPNKDRRTDVRHRDRATRSSNEGAVIALERRGSGIPLRCAANRFAGGAA